VAGGINGSSIRERGVRQASSGRLARANGAARVVRPQAGGPIGSHAIACRAARILLLGSAALALQGCGLTTSSMGGTAPRRAEPTPPSADEAAAPPAAAPAPLEAPGVELRSAADRAGIDVTHYDVRVDLSDPASGVIRAEATLTLDRRGAGEWIELDFAGLDIEDVRVNGSEARFLREGSRLRIDASGVPADGIEVAIRYSGTPADGLFFGNDANGDPAVFADNWPNRARWWFPANDHPSDKATARITVRVPPGYGVISNGHRLDVRESENGTTWVWETDPAAPIPTYTMVVGIARFETRGLAPAACGRAPAGDDGDCADVSVWALAGDGDYGAERFARAPDMVDFYAGLVGPYPYEKLAHVESSTRFGGMENSSAIFYGRGGWESRRMGEGVIAHETAHQWFGDAVTPAGWAHLWVSEGFASYFGPLYFETRDGVEAFRERMSDIARTAKTSDVIGQAIVDSSSNRLFDYLNANNYQKGAWVLHMLRGLLGDETFFAGIRDYYARHRHGTASTADVRAALERASGRDLSEFFSQWLYAPGYPRLAIEWRIEDDRLVLDVRQRQPPSWPAYTMMAEIEIRRRGGTTFRLPVEIAGRSQTLRFGGMADVVDVVFDPDGWILHDADVTRRPAP